MPLSTSSQQPSRPKPKLILGNKHLKQTPVAAVGKKKPTAEVLTAAAQEPVLNGALLSFDCVLVVLSFLVVTFDATDFANVPPTDSNQLKAVPMLPSLPASSKKLVAPQAAAQKTKALSTRPSTSTQAVKPASITTNFIAIRSLVIRKMYGRRNGEGTRCSLWSACSLNLLGRSVASRYALKLIALIPRIEDLQISILQEEWKENALMLPPWPGKSNLRTLRLKAYVKHPEKRLPMLHLSATAASSIRQWQSLDNLELEYIEVVDSFKILVSENKLWDSLVLTHLRPNSTDQVCSTPFRAKSIDIKRSYPSKDGAFSLASCVHTDLERLDIGNLDILGNQFEGRLHRLKYFKAHETNCEKFFQAMRNGAFPVLEDLSLLRLSGSKDLVHVLSDALKFQASLHPLEYAHMQLYFSHFLGDGETFDLVGLMEALALHRLKRLVLSWTHSPSTFIPDNFGTLLAPTLEELHLNSLVCDLSQVEVLARILASATRLRFLCFRGALAAVVGSMSKKLWCSKITESFKTIAERSRGTFQLEIIPDADLDNDHFPPWLRAVQQPRIQLPPLN